MNKAKMTFRFDEPNRKPANNAAMQEQSETKVVSLNEYKSDYGVWSSPQDELDAIEREIRESDRMPQIPAGKERPEQDGKEEADTIVWDGETGYVEVDETWKGGSYRTPGSPSWFKIFISVTGAIATGAIFGFVVLSLFNGDVQIPGLDKLVADDVKTGAAIAPSGRTDVKQADPEAKEAATVQTQPLSVAVDIPAQNYYMLQYGVFSGLEGVNQAKQELQQKGLAAYADTGDKNRVYAGVAVAREDAMLLTQQFKAQGIEFYVRTVELPAISQMTYAGDAKQVSQYFEQSAGMVRLLNDVAIARLMEKEPKALSESQLQAIRNEHQRWTELESKAQSGLPAEAKELWSQMTKAMNSAVVAMNEYNKKTSETHLWEVQSAMMDYIMLEKSFLETIGT
ncbi:SPOR domain-containing protein [Paenibacillus sp. MSJ-34]|uniref:SPOR domain-containing protein n=1 Tax=Paenibacillus sp. MSJ-34 TaxID=2841529 RepID=UPI001C0F4F3D|nr:SPOR domain-containing protein [Paenibacillus sp. MSJ-34]MBU5444672.1 SPOR domain-containing protein [Paenibacillus sp. MSJ-34]